MMQSPPGSGFEVTGVHRFTLPVRSLATSEIFYTQVLGGDVVQRDAVELGAWETRPCTSR